MKRAKKILFVGGGTTGHIAPLIAVMEAVKTLNPDAQCSYVGQLGDLSSPVFTDLELECSRHAISAGKLNRFVTPRHLSEVLKLGRGFYEALSLLCALKPDVIFSKGGFVSVPVVMIAHFLGIPVYSHESDVVPGVANRIVARDAELIFTAYPVAHYRKLPTKKLRYVGQPVRERFFDRQQIPDEVGGQALQHDLPLLVVTGSSQGAHRINTLVSGAWEHLLETFQIVHQCGDHEYRALLEAKLALPEKLQHRLALVATLPDLAPYFQKAELVISRSGGVVAELAAARAATILIPLSTAAQNHQWKNAQVLEEANAAVVLDERTLTSVALEAVVDELHQDASRRNELRQAIESFANTKTARAIAEVLLA